MVSKRPDEKGAGKKKTQTSKRTSSSISKPYRTSRGSRHTPQAKNAYHKGIHGRHYTLTTGSTTRLRTFHPSFLSKLTHLTHRLMPLVSVTTGQPHPAFPSSLLNYHLLSAWDLDSIAAHYHQTIPEVRQSSEYPVRIKPWVDVCGRPVLDIPTETKRRRIGQFIGLRGCGSVDGEGEGGDFEKEV